MMLRKACCAVPRFTGTPVSEAYATSLVKAPSNSRTLDLMERAMNSATSSASGKCSKSAFFWRMAILVSRSGGWISAINPHSKRERKRSSIAAISLGGQSEDSTICFCRSCKELKVVGGLRRVLGWRRKCGVRDLMGPADDKCVERVSQIELMIGTVEIETRLLDRRCGRRRRLRLAANEIELQVRQAHFYQHRL